MSEAGKPGDSRPSIHRGSQIDLYRQAPGERRQTQTSPETSQQTEPPGKHPTRIHIIEVPPHILPNEQPTAHAASPQEKQTQSQPTPGDRLTDFLDRKDITLGRREASIALAAAIAGVAGVIERKRIGAFLQRRFLGSSRPKTEPEPQATQQKESITLLPTDELVTDQNEIDLSAIESYGYSWRTVDKNGREKDSAKPVIAKMDLVAQQLGYGTEPKFRVRQGIQKDAEGVDISESQMRAMFPELEIDVVRLIGESKYTIEATGEQTDTWYGIASGITDEKNERKGVFLSINKEKDNVVARPVHEGEAPSVISANFGNIVHVSQK